MGPKQLIILEYDIKEPKTWFTLTGGDFLFDIPETYTCTQVNYYARYIEEAMRYG